MRDGEEQGGSGARETERQGAISGESGSVPREREEGREATEEDPMTRSWVEVPLTRGKVAKVDRQDMLIIGGFTWCARPSTGNHSHYALRSQRTAGPTRTIYMHRWIMEPPPGMVVDHINGDGLDNRRSNLRVCVQGQNVANRTRRAVMPVSGFIGVCRNGTIRWAARVGGANSTMRSHLGQFDTAEEAARAYDEAVVRLYGEFATTNFPTPGGGGSLYPSAKRDDAHDEADDQRDRRRERDRQDR